MVDRPSRRSFSSVTGPTPGMTETGSGADQLQLGAGFDHPLAIRLGELGRELRHELRARGADRGGSPPVTSETSRLSSAKGVVETRRRQVHRVGRHPRSTNASSRDSGSTSGDRSRSTRHDLLAGGPVGPEATRQERRMGAPPTRLMARHGRTHAEHAGLVGSGCHHAPLTDPTDDDRLAAQRRLVPLLDGCEERVQIEMQDGCLATHRTILTARPDDPHQLVRSCLLGSGLSGMLISFLADRRSTREPECCCRADP